jgi:outer membrane protein TolC
MHNPVGIELRDAISLGLIKPLGSQDAGSRLTPEASGVFNAGFRQQVMHSGILARWLLLMPGFLFIAATVISTRAQGAATNISQIDLPSALKLAGAQNLDIQLARERLAEAKANHAGALARFFPWISPGIAYRQHDDKIQDVEGNIIDVHKYSYAPGATLGAQVEVGDALFQSLAAKQLATAAAHGLEAQRQDVVLAGAQGYFELALAQASVGVARESVKISTDYDDQLQHAVSAGLAFKGDQLRVRVQLERDQLALRQAMEQQRVASARLSQVLRLDPTLELAAQDSELAPLTLLETNSALASLVGQALSSREELKQNQSLITAARDVRKGASYGPLIPTVGAQGFFGGLGGGRRGVSDTFGDQEDYAVGLSWRIGPGGLFDFSRVRSAEARVKQADITAQKLRDDISRQVVEAFTHWQSSSDQLATAQRALTAAQGGLHLAQERKEFAVGIVLENIQAEQDLTRARLDYLKAMTEFNKAQYALRKAIGDL